MLSSLRMPDDAQSPYPVSTAEPEESPDGAYRVASSALRKRPSLCDTVAGEALSSPPRTKTV